MIDAEIGKHAAGFLLLVVLQSSSLLAVKFAAKEKGQRSSYTFSPQACLAVAELFKLTLSAGAVLRHEDVRLRGTWRGIQYILQSHISAKLILTYLGLGVAYALNNDLTFVVSTMADPGSVSLVKSFAPCLTALTVRLLYSRPLNTVQIIAILLISLGTILFQMDACHGTPKLSATAYYNMVVSVLITTFCSVINAETVKQAQCPLSIQNVLLYTVGTMANFIIHQSRFPGRSMFDGMSNPLALLITIINCFMGLAINWVYTFSNAIVKSVASCFSTALLVFLSSVFFDVPLTMQTVIGSSVVVLSTCVYMAIADPMNEAPQILGTSPVGQKLIPSRTSCLNLSMVMILACLSANLYFEIEIPDIVGLKRIVLNPINQTNPLAQLESDGRVNLSTESGTRLKHEVRGKMLNTSWDSDSVERNSLPLQKMAATSLGSVSWEPWRVSVNISSKLGAAVIVAHQYKVIKVSTCEFDFKYSNRTFRLRFCDDFKVWPYFWDGTVVPLPSSLQKHRQAQTTIKCHSSEIGKQTLMSKIANSARLQSREHYRTCAIVGGAEQTKAYGAEIDNAEAVIRVNLHGVNAESSMYVGRRCTHRIIDHVAFAALHFLRGGVPIRGGKINLAQLIAKENCTVVGSCVALTIGESSSCHACLRAFKEKKKSLSSSISNKIQVISPEIELKFFESMGVRGSQTGAITLALAQSMCDQIRVYGMSELSQATFLHGKIQYTRVGGKGKYQQAGPDALRMRVFAWQELMGLTGKVIFRRN